MRGGILVRLAAVLAIAAMVGCASSGTKAPAWFLSPPDDPAFYVASAQGEAMREMLAINKAKELAKADISGQVEQRVGSLTKLFQEEVGTGEGAELLESYSQAIKTVTSQTLNGVRTKEVNTMQRKNGSYVAYVLMVLPKADLARQMMDETRNRENLYQRFRASQAYEELQQELDAYEQSQ